MGTNSACGGSRFAARNTASKVRLNLKLKRASTNAMQEARNSVSTTAGTVITAEFQKCRPKSPWFQALT